MFNIINSLFQQREFEGYLGKELVKEVIKELVKDYKREFSKGDNPIAAINFGSWIKQIWQAAQSRGIDISREEIASGVMKEILSK